MKAYLAAFSWNDKFVLLSYFLSSGLDKTAKSSRDLSLQRITDFWKEWNHFFYFWPSISNSFVAQQCLTVAVFGSCSVVPLIRNYSQSGHWWHPTLTMKYQYHHHWSQLSVCLFALKCSNTMPTGWWPLEQCVIFFCVCLFCLFCLLFCPVFLLKAQQCSAVWFEGVGAIKTD